MRWLFTAILSLILLLAGPARADQQSPPPDVKATELKTESLHKDFQITFYPQFTSRHQFDNLMPERDPPGIRYLYGGIQYVILKQMERYYYRYRNQYVDDLQGSQRSFFEIEQEQLRFMEGQSDLETGRWWERSWEDSRLPENGGAPYERPVVHRGEEVDVFDWGWLKLTNEGKVTLGNFFLYLEGQRNKTLTNDPPPDIGVRTVVFKLGQAQDGHVTKLLIKGMQRYVDIRIRPLVTLQMPTSKDLNPLGKIAVAIDGKIIPDGKHCFATFTAKVEFNHDRDISASFYLNILIF